MLKHFTFISLLDIFWITTTHFQFDNPYSKKNIKIWECFQRLRNTSHAKYNPISVRLGNQRYPSSGFESQNKLYNDLDMKRDNRWYVPRYDTTSLLQLPAADKIKSNSLLVQSIHCSRIVIMSAWMTIFIWLGLYLNNVLVISASLPKRFSWYFCTSSLHLDLKKKIYVSDWIIYTYDTW